MDLTPALKQYVEDKLISLTKYYSGLTQVRVELERTTKHHHKGGVWRAEANISGPQHLFRVEAVANDIYAAIDEMKDELKRELKALKEKRARLVRRARQTKRER